MKTKKNVYIVTKVIQYKYQVEADDEKEALREVKEGYDPHEIKLIRESAKISK